MDALQLGDLCAAGPPERASPGGSDRSGAGPASRPTAAPTLLGSAGARVPPHRRAAPRPGRHRVPPPRPAARARSSRPRAAPSCEIDPATITALVREAVRDIQHLLRPSHLAQLRAIVDDPEASPNDRFVATDLLRNACVSAGGVLPMCQDTGTAIVIGKRTETVLTGGDDEEAISRGRLRGLRRAEPALLADGADVVLGRAQHRHQPARPGRAVHRAGRRPRSTSSW